MNDPEDTQGKALTTEQIAAGEGAGGGPDMDPPLAPGAQTPADAQAAPLAPASEPLAPASQPGFGNDHDAAGPHPQLLKDDELQLILAQWKDIQAEFVDEPRQAVQEADALVADLMQRLAQTFASERERLESRWSGGEEVSTEDLRRGLRRYRSFFERLLAA